MCYTLCYSYGMKRHATQSDSQKSGNHGASFRAVIDSRKRRIVGLWQRGAKFYGQMRIDNGNGTTTPKRIPLEASNLDEAKAALEKARTENRAGDLPTIGHAPKFADFADAYLASETLRQKKARTAAQEGFAIDRWKAHLGGVRIDKITPAMIHSFRDKRLAAGRAARTTNLDVVALRNVLKLAVNRGIIERLPVVRQLKQKPPERRPLLTKAQFQKLIDKAEGTTKNADLFRFYVRFLALTGSREVEALKVRWKDVDDARQTVTIGAGGVSKNHRARTVDFSPELRALIGEMKATRPPDTTWLFPSPQRGAADIHAKSLRESLRAVRTKAELPWVGFHDLRHFFASTCVMAGIDFMTTASWLGHSDGGILVGKVYGHLNDTHKRDAAQKLTFF